MRKLVWTITANHEIAEIFRELARYRLSAADRWLTKAQANIELLKDFPTLGALVHRSPTEVRQVIVGSFRIFYRVEENAVVLLRALHVRRDYDGSQICDAPPWPPELPLWPET